MLLLLNYCALQYSISDDNVDECNKAEHLPKFLQSDYTKFFIMIMVFSYNTENQIDSLYIPDNNNKNFMTFVYHKIKIIIQDMKKKYPTWKDQIGVLIDSNSNSDYYNRLTECVMDSVTNHDYNFTHLTNIVFKSLCGTKNMKNIHELFIFLLEKIDLSQTQNKPYISLIIFFVNQYICANNLRKDEQNNTDLLTKVTNILCSNQLILNRYLEKNIMYYTILSKDWNNKKNEHDKYITDTNEDTECIHRCSGDMPKILYKIMNLINKKIGQQENNKNDNQKNIIAFQNCISLIHWYNKISVFSYIQFGKNQYYYISLITNFLMQLLLIKFQKEIEHPGTNYLFDLNDIISVNNDIFSIYQEKFLCRKSNLLLKEFHEFWQLKNKEKIFFDKHRGSLIEVIFNVGLSLFECSNLLQFSEEEQEFTLNSVIGAISKKIKTVTQKKTETVTQKKTETVTRKRIETVELNEIEQVCYATHTIGSLPTHHIIFLLRIVSHIICKKAELVAKNSIVESCINIYLLYSKIYLLYQKGKKNTQNQLWSFLSFFSSIKAITDFCDQFLNDNQDDTTDIFTTSIIEIITMFYEKVFYNSQNFYVFLGVFFSLLDKIMKFDLLLTTSSKNFRTLNKQSILEYKDKFDKALSTDIQQPKNNVNSINIKTITQYIDICMQFIDKNTVQQGQSQVDPYLQEKFCQLISPLKPYCMHHLSKLSKKQDGSISKLLANIESIICNSLGELFNPSCTIKTHNWVNLGMPKILSFINDVYLKIPYDLLPSMLVKQRTLCNWLADNKDGLTTIVNSCIANIQIDLQHNNDKLSDVKTIDNNDKKQNNLYNNDRSYDKNKQSKIIWSIVCIGGLYITYIMSIIISNITRYKINPIHITHKIVYKKQKTIPKSLVVKKRSQTNINSKSHFTNTI